MAKISQKNMIEQHLIDYGHISGLEALSLYGVYRLSAVIFELRKKGDKIYTTFEKQKNKFGDDVEYGVYHWGVKDEQ